MGVSSASRPQVPVSVAARPVVQSSSVGRPQRTLSVAPAGTVPRQPQKAMEQTIEALLTFDVGVRQLPITFLTPVGELVPDVSVVMVPTGGVYVMDAPATLSVEVASAVVPQTGAAASFDIAAVADPVPTLPVSATAQFDVSVSQYMLANQGIDKSGNQILTAANTWTRLSPWAVRSGYPATVIVDGDGIRVPAGVVASYEYRLAVSSAAGTGNTQSMRLVNGSTVVDSVTIANTTTTTTRTGTFTGTGEVARLEASVTSPNSGRGTITASTYLVLNVV